MVKTKLDITQERTTFKPFKYPWAYDAWLQHEQSHWLHSEVPMSEDVKDYKKLSKQEQEFLTKILRFFVQGDLDIGSGYHDHYIPIFKQPEVRMMLSGFAGREALHVAAYAHLIETLGLPESTYNEFLEYKEMVEKHDYINNLSAAPMAEKIAAISAFGEGMQLFSSFVMLLNFARNGKLKGLGQIIAWSIVDETQHAEGMIKVYREYVKNNKDESTSDRIKEIADQMVVKVASYRRENY
jgi:ribonucleoside-diphosphate reductase beta chain